VKFDLEQWDGHKGALKLGFFDDSLTREFNQDSFSNFGDQGSLYHGHWSDPWSSHFPDETGHPVTASNADVDYHGEQDIRASYGMVDLPLSSALSINFGARMESTKISIVNNPEADAFWFPPGASAPVHLNPGDADVTVQQDDVLPSLGLMLEATKELTLRASYGQTIAHQTFKELTPIMQQEFLGGPVFIGNPELRMSALKNYDLRADYVPYEGALCSASWFQKDITDPIEYVQRLAGFTYTTPINYPKGEMTGYEFELRQELEHLWRELHGFSFGANATFIDSKVTLPADEALAFSEPGIAAPMTSRDMTNAPDHLYNFFLTYDFDGAGTQIGLFYTVQGDTLIAGAGESLGNFIPSLYAKEYDTLNLTLSHVLGKHLKLTLQAKNLTNPRIEEIYRSTYIGSDVTKTSYTKGIEYSLALTLNL
jgi:TonB-dependent receptor